MSDFVTALGLVLVIEGALYAVAPSAMRDILKTVHGIDPATLRRGGLMAAIVGVGVVWLVRG